MRQNARSVFQVGFSALWLGLALSVPVSAADKPLVDLEAELGKIKQEMKASQPQKTAKPAATSQEKASQQASSKPVKAENTQPHDKPVQWSYSGETGPRYWGELSADFTTCHTGRNQSPVDLRDERALGTQGLAGLDIVYREVPLKITHNGHTVKVDFPLGSYIKVGGKRYELMQYHFHTPSEHHKEGFAYPMEMHLVHRDGDGNLVVIGILFQEGEANPYLNGLLKRLPKEVGKQEIHTDLKLNPVNFIPPNTEFYKYSGSLTTPPCSEGVYWMVFKHPVEASALQIRKMNELMGENARPVQPLNARSLLKSWFEPDNDRQFYEFY